MSNFVYEACCFLGTFFFFCAALQAGVGIRVFLTEGLAAVVAQYKTLYGRFYAFLLLHILFLLLTS